MKRYLLFILAGFILLSLNAIAQDEIYYFGSTYQILPSIENARYQKQVIKKSESVCNIKSLYKDEKGWKVEKIIKLKIQNYGSQKLSIKTKSVFAEKITRLTSVKADGSYHFEEYSQDKLVRSGSASKIIPLLLQDTVIQYYPNGKVSSIAIYNENQLVKNQNWLPDGSEYINNTYVFTDKVPEYEYGDKQFKSYILSNLMDSGLDITQVNDKIVLGWVIMEDGTLQGIHVISGKITTLNNLLMKIIDELPGDWIPATINGKSVRYYMKIPFNFSNSQENFDSIELSGGLLIWD